MNNRRLFLDYKYCKNLKNSLLTEILKLFFYIDCSFSSFLAPFEQTFCVTISIIFKFNMLFSPYFLWFPHIYFLDCCFVSSCSPHIVIFLINSFPWTQKAFRISSFFRCINSSCGWPSDHLCNSLKPEDWEAAWTAQNQLHHCHNFVVRWSRNSQ